MKEFLDEKTKQDIYDAYVNTDMTVREIAGMCGVAKSTVSYVAEKMGATLRRPKEKTDVVEVRHDFNVGDFCLYGFADGNKSLAIVEIVKILEDERGIAEVGFLKVIRDNTGNGYFNYLFNKGKTMDASFCYLKNITPKIDEREKNEG